MKQIKLLWNIFSSIRFHLDADTFILQIKGTQFTFTEKDLLINTKGVIGLNSSQEEITNSQNHISETSVPSLETYRRQKCETPPNKQVANAESN